MRLILAFFLISCTACQSTGANVEAVPEMAKHRVVFTSGDGADIDGYLFRPDRAKPGPALVLMHGCGGLLTKSGRMKQREAAWRDILLQEGYVLLYIDSFNPRGHRRICNLKNRPVLPERERPHDAFAALRWLQQQPGVDPKRIGLFGWSNGAMATLWTVRENAAQRPAGLQHDFAAAVGFYPGCIKIGRTGFKAAIPTLLQVGLADDWTKPLPCLALVERANGAGGAVMEIDAYADAAHGFDHPNSKPRTVNTNNDVYVSSSKNVTVGTNLKARAAAIERVKAYLRAALKPA